MGENLKKVIEQVTSGRWILTVVCGLVFAFASWKKILTPEAITAIISMVFVSYFSRNRPEEKKGGQQ